MRNVVLPERLLIKALLHNVFNMILEFLYTKALFYHYRGSSFEVILGAHFVLQQEATQVLITTADKHIHPNWDSQTLENDIALLKLPFKVELNGKGNTLFLLLPF